LGAHTPHWFKTTTLSYLYQPILCGQFFLFLFHVSQICVLSDCLFVDVGLRVLQLIDGLVDQDPELVLPTVVQIIKSLVALHAVLGHVRNEVLRGFRVFLRDLSVALARLCLVLLCLFVLVLARAVRRKDRRRRQNLIKVLELLPCTLLISIRNRLVINVRHVRESVNNKCPHHARLRHFVLLNVQAGQGRKRF